MTDEEIFRTFQTAITSGGSFYAGLANAGLAADPQNKALILKTWPRLTSEYGPTSIHYKHQWKTW